MQKFYKIAWEVLFTLLYPFITLFSLLFIGVVSVVSTLSRIITQPFQKEQEDQSVAPASTDWQSVATNGNFVLHSKPLQQIQFGPMIYQFRTTPADVAGLEEGYWSDFIVPFGQGFLLQRWPSIEEHELESFELVYIRQGLTAPARIHVMPTFYWKVQDVTDNSLLIVWEEEEEMRLQLTTTQLP